jgi:hypothetical protein
MNLEKINELLLSFSRKPTTKAIFLPKVVNDSDEVFEIDYVSSQFATYVKRNTHEIFDSHQGWCILTCYKTKKRFFHLIQVPNKLCLFCRTCQKDI